MVGSVPRFDVATGSPAKQRADLLLLPAFQGPEAGPGVREVGRALDVEITSLLEEDGFRGSLGEISTLPTLGRGEARTVAVLGLGPKDEATSERIRRAAGRAAATAGRYKTVAATVPAGGKGPWREAVEAFVEGLLLGAYRSARSRTRCDRRGGTGSRSWRRPDGTPRRPGRRCAGARSWPKRCRGPATS